MKNYMKETRGLLILIALCLAVLNSGCATSKANVSKSHALSVAEVEALGKARLNDDVIISQIKNSGTIYHLSATDILGLHDAGISDRVIEYMINTPPTATESAVVAPVAVAPAYYYPYPWWCWVPPVSFAFRFH